MDAVMREMVIRAFEVGRQVNRDYTEAMFGSRKSGSQFGTWVPRTPQDFIDPRNQFEMVPPDQLPKGTYWPGCIYLRSTAPHVIDDAVEEISSLPDLPPEIQKTVRIETGPRGPELVTDANLRIGPAHEMWLLLGPVSKTDGRLIPYSVYPGRLARGLNPELGDNMTDVKALIASGIPYSVKSKHDAQPGDRA